MLSWRPRRTLSWCGPRRAAGSAAWMRGPWAWRPGASARAGPGRKTRSRPRPGSSAWPSPASEVDGRPARARAARRRPGQVRPRARGARRRDRDWPGTARASRPGPRPDRMTLGRWQLTITDIRRAPKVTAARSPRRRPAAADRRRTRRGAGLPRAAGRGCRRAGRLDDRCRAARSAGAVPGGVPAHRRGDADAGRADPGGGRVRGRTWPPTASSTPRCASRPSCTSTAG